jgi:hypothetical protein
VGRNAACAAEGTTAGTVPVVVNGDGTVGVGTSGARAGVGRNGRTGDVVPAAPVSAR